jgi:4-hydroxythreonine-4-phosphate dehydrogenase
MGDPAGIGPEIIAKLWAEGGLPPAVVIGDVAIMRRAVGIVGASLSVRGVYRQNEAWLAPGAVHRLPVGALAAALPFGPVAAAAHAMSNELARRWPAHRSHRHRAPEQGNAAAGIDTRDIRSLAAHSAP